LRKRSLSLKFEHRTHFIAVLVFVLLTAIFNVTSHQHVFTSLVTYGQNWSFFSYFFSIIVSIWNILGVEGYAILYAKISAMVLGSIIGIVIAYQIIFKSMTLRLASYLLFLCAY